jgi:hypothetical protein
MAIALLLWMLAAMALTVSAVVHFSQGDVSMAQLRLQESRAWWLGRGLVHLAVRDQILASLDPMDIDANNDSDVSDSETPGDDNPASNVIFSREYNFGDVSARVTLYPAEGLVSLNTAPPEQLLQLFQAVGGLDVNSAQNAVEGVLAYRDQSSPVTFDMMQHPGFRYVEELLAIPGITRTAYDELKPWLHVHRTGGFNPQIAPPTLARLFAGDNELAEAGSVAPRAEVSGGMSRGSRGAANAVAQPLTFDSMYAQARPRGAGGGNVMVAQLRFVFDGSDHYQQMIHFDAQSQELLRVGPVMRVNAGARL